MLEVEAVHIGKMEVQGVVDLVEEVLQLQVQVRQELLI
jgi:hypothetical protein